MFLEKHEQKSSFTLYKVNYKPSLNHSFDFTHYIGVICQRELFKILVGSKWQQIKQIRLHGKALQNRASVFTLSMALHVALMFKGLEGPQNLTSITTFMIVTFMIVLPL